MSRGRCIGSHRRRHGRRRDERIGAGLALIASEAMTGRESAVAFWTDAGRFGADVRGVAERPSWRAPSHKAIVARATYLRKCYARRMFRPDHAAR